MSGDAILAIDIGGGTQDILFWDPADRIENCVKLVIPSPTRVAARRIRDLTAKGHDIFCEGVVMGGGAVTQAVTAHIKAGLGVYAHPKAALTFHDNLDYVRDMGVILTEERPADAESVRLGDIDLETLAATVAPYGVEVPGRIAVAVQDHGFSPHESNRSVRFRNLARFLASGGNLADRVYESPPEENTRMWAIKEVRPDALVMDTGTAAILGALLDETVAARRNSGVLVTNIGNAHTLAAVVVGERVLALYEHHTGCLDPQTLGNHLDRFAKGVLTHEEVFNAMGHGVTYAPGFTPFESALPIAVTGPQRAMASGIPCRMVAPFGDMMLCGCFGLVEGAREKWRLPYTLNPYGR